MIAASYASKSTDQTGVADEAKSVARQIEHARAYANRKGWYILVAAVLIVPLDAAGQGYVGEERETLRGLQGVKVLVEALEADAGRDGLTETAIQTDTELKLRAAAIRVLPHAYSVPLPFLYINVSTKKRDTGLYAVHVSVTLKQEVSSRVRPGVSFLAGTWHVGVLGIVGANNLRTVRDNVKDLVDQFINDYLAVNPNKGG